MQVSSQEMGYLYILIDEVKKYLKNPRMTKPEKTSIGQVCERILPKLTPGMQFTATWNYSNRPFLMEIRPNMEELEQKAGDLIKIMNDPKCSTEDYLRKWCEIKHWELSLDPRLLTKGHPCCVDDGRQFAAILCHEIGHVMNRDPIEMVNTYRRNLITMSKAERMMMSSNPIIHLLVMPMFIATESFRVIIKHNNEAEAVEIAADAYVPTELRGDLVAYIENHVLNNPEIRETIQTESDYNGEKNVSFKYSKSTLELMEKRRDVLKKHIEAQYKSPDSDNYIKKMMKRIGAAIGKFDPASGESNIMSENMIASRYQRDLNTVMEQTAAVLESIKVTDRDLTILEIEIEDIKTNEDKLYVIQTIYDYMEAISKQQSDRIKKLQKSGCSKTEIDEILARDTRMNQLNKMKTRVLGIKIAAEPDHYGLFVQYPKGYEG